MHKDMRYIYIAYGATILIATLTLSALPYAPLWNALLADIIATAVIFGFSRFFKNSSFYDAYWSVIPPLIMLYWIASGPNAGEPRVWLVFGLVTFWSIRLTWNWASHWQGLNHEDWRYIELRAKVGPALAPWLDFLGIHLLPTLQVFTALLPVYVITQFPGRPLNTWDIIAALVTFGAVMTELIADRQLHRFLALHKPGEIMKQGLWAWSRHPNYFGELSFWVGLTLFALAASPSHYHWALPGALLMTAMFLFISIPMMDKRSADRRPGYREHMQGVSALIPRPPRKRADSVA
jgi:steroid 5-alpha reductase family enzyme